jgi:phenylacetate-CoA ligase
VTIDQTAAYWLLYRAIKLRLLRSYGYDLRAKQVEIIPPPAGRPPGAVERVRGEWPFNALFEAGPIVRADIFQDIASQIALLDVEAPHYLLTHPSNLRLLLAEYRRTGRSIPTLRLVRTRAEQLDPELRAECLDVLGVSLFDTYGATECGYVAVQCPEHDQYHVQSELNFVEVLKDDGTPCKRGEIGRIVVTPLHAFAMPLLRYALDDYAEVGDLCPCGRGLPVLRRIFGRHKELLTLPSGEKRYSTFASYVFGALPAVAQFQIVQKSLLEIEARIVPIRPLTEPERTQIAQGLRAQLGPAFTIEIKPVDHIPRLPGGKFMEFVSEL